MSVQLALDVAQAPAVLRARAYADGRTLAELTRDVVVGRVRLDSHDSPLPDNS